MTILLVPTVTYIGVLCRKIKNKKLSQLSFVCQIQEEYKFSSLKELYMVLQYYITLLNWRVFVQLPQLHIQSKAVGSSNRSLYS